VTPTPINNSNKRDNKPFGDAEKLARIVDQAIMQAKLQRIYDVVRDYQVNDTTSIITDDDRVVDEEEKVEDEEEVLSKSKQLDINNFNVTFRVPKNLRLYDQAKFTISMLKSFIEDLGVKVKYIVSDKRKLCAIEIDLGQKMHTSHERYVLSFIVNEQTSKNIVPSEVKKRFENDWRYIMGKLKLTGFDSITYVFVAKRKFTYGAYRLVEKMNKGVGNIIYSTDIVSAITRFFTNNKFLAIRLFNYLYKIKGNLTANNIMKITGLISIINAIYRLLTGKVVVDKLTLKTLKTPDDVIKVLDKFFRRKK